MRHLDAPTTRGKPEEDIEGFLMNPFFIDAPILA